MKRLVLSVVGGILIPFLYSILAGPLTTQIDNEVLEDYLGYPVRWPILILFALEVQLNEIGLIVIAIVANVTLYSLLTYCALIVFSRPKEQYVSPPPPDGV